AGDGADGDRRAAGVPAIRQAPPGARSRYDDRMVALGGRRPAADPAGAGDSGVLRPLVRPRRAAGRAADAAPRRAVADPAVAGLGPGVAGHARAVGPGVPPGRPQAADRYGRWRGTG